MPPATAQRVDQLRSAGRLSVLRGRVIAVADEPAGLCVGIEQGAQVTEIAAGWLINATGPAADVTATTDPPLRGQLYETTAIPEIRDQAAALAGPLLAACCGRTAPLAAPSLPGKAGSAA